MLIVCPTCATAYQLTLAAVGEGRQVRCSHCRNTWFANAESVIEQTVMEPAAAQRERTPAEPDDIVAFDPPREEIIPPSPAAPENPFTVADAPPLVPESPPVEAEAALKFDPGVPDRAEAIAAHPARPAYAELKDRRGLLRRLLSLPMLIAVMTVLVLSALNWRAAVVRQFPQTASLYARLGLPVNLRGLFFEDVKSRSELQDGVTVLIIEGTIVNLTTRTLDVPRLRFALRNATGHEVYAWTAQPAKPTVGSGNGLPFRARLASPPPDGRDVIVRFLTRRDVAAGSS